MKIEYDSKHDILNVEFSEEDIEESVEENGIIIDYSKSKKIISIEIIDAKKRIGEKALENADFSKIVGESSA